MNSMRKFDYSHVSNDNDMSNTSRRNPIRVIDHYGSGTTTRNSNNTNNNSSSANSSSNYQAQQQVSSRNSPISIKIETHSPVHLKSTSNLYESTTTSSSGASSFQQQQQHNQSSPSHDQKFNGRSNCSPPKKRPLLLYFFFQLSPICVPLEIMIFFKNLYLNFFYLQPLGMSA